MENTVLIKGKKFYISRNTLFWAVLSAVVSTIIYIVMLTIIARLESGSQHVPYGCYVVRDVFLVVATILFTVILTGLLVETRTKNELYHDTIFLDVVSNPAFYQAFSPEVKSAMLNTLEKELLFGGNVPLQGMYVSLQSQLSRAREKGYYYSSASVTIVWSIDESTQTITRETVRTVKIRSYDEQRKVENFPILSWEGVQMDNCFILNGVSIDGHSLQDYSLLDCANHSGIPRSLGGYTAARHYTYKDKLTLYRNRDTTVSISYVAKTPLAYNLYTCRTAVPCQQFSVEAFLKTPGNYKLNAATFGVLRSVEESPMRANPQQVHVSFEDWMFEGDGVCIACISEDL